MQLLENSPGGSFTPREMVPAQLRELQKGVSTPRGACRAPIEEPLLQLRIRFYCGGTSTSAYSTTQFKSLNWALRGVSAPKGARGRAPIGVSSPVDPERLQ